MIFKKLPQNLKVNLKGVIFLPQKSNTDSFYNTEHYIVFFIVFNQNCNVKHNFIKCNYNLICEIIYILKSKKLFPYFLGKIATKSETKFLKSVFFFQ